ncbi:MAG: hypothetical protein ACK449_07150 [Planctomycetota bacterium]|jgi:hypothetical protein
MHQSPSMSFLIHESAEESYSSEQVDRSVVWTIGRSRFDSLPVPTWPVAAGVQSSRHTLLCRQPGIDG